MATFADRLKELRRERKLKQRELAEAYGIQIRTYQDYEYGKCYPTALGLVFLADYFGVSLDYLMGRSDCREVRRP